MKQIYSWEKQDTNELTNEFHQWAQEVERELTMPDEWIKRFGKWDQLKDWVEDLIYSYGARVEELDELEKIQKKYDALQEELKLIASDMNAVDEIDLSEEHGEGCVLISTNVIKSYDEDMGLIMKRIENCADENWEPYSRPKDKKKKKTIR